MFGFLKKKKSGEELYLEELEQRRQQAGAPAGAGFEMTVQDVFSISGRGTVVTGTVSRGTISRGDRVLLRGRDGRVLETKVGGIEAFRKVLQTAKAGDTVGLLLSGVSKDQVRPGDVLTAS